MNDKKVERKWPEQGISRVPAWVYSDPDLFKRELEQFHHGATWNYIGLECEIPEPGDYLRSFVGIRPVLATRDASGNIHVVDNRCAHRGAPLCWDHRGRSQDLTCVYHQWCFSHGGDLQGMPFFRGVKGHPGMPKDFKKSEHGLRKLRVQVRGGVIWATYDHTTPEFDVYAGSGILQELDRVFNGKELRLLGYSRQLLPCNWKLYFENTRDTYHAGLMHSFFTTFLSSHRADRTFKTAPYEGGKHETTSTTYSAAKDPGEEENVKQIASIRSGMTLNDPETVETIDEFHDDKMATLQVFPSLMFQQHANVLAVRHILPKTVESTEVAWTFFGYADDDERMRRARLKQANIVGPAGFVSMDDSEVLAQVQQAVAANPDTEQVIEMGGRDNISAGTTMVTESLLRAFYDFYRRELGL